MKTYGIVKHTYCNGMFAISRMSSGYEMQKARQRCDELNRIQKPKNNTKLSIKYLVTCD